MKATEIVFELRQQIEIIKNMFEKPIWDFCNGFFNVYENDKIIYQKYIGGKDYFFYDGYLYSTETNWKAKI